MKKLTLFVALFMLFQVTFAGGILTNANQSAQYVRMLSRNASTQLDAVYFNPAGLIKLENGFHLGISNQSIFQTRTVTSEYWSPSKEYIGKISAPVFPDLFAAWKNDKIALSFMFGPIGGGGGAKYDNGLPSFEKQIAQMASGYKMLAPVFSTYSIPSVTGYDAGITFEGTSVFWGAQLNGSYAINDMISVSLGARVLLANNTYNGSINDIEVKTANGNIPASQYQSTVKPIMNGLIQTLNTSYTGLEAAIGAGYIDGGANITDPQLLAVLGMLGANASTYNEAVVVLKTTEGQLTQLNNSNLADKSVDTKQTGTGIIPIIGLNISPVENLNIGIKYEFKTVLELTNDTKEDGTGMFVDGKKSNSDMPALLMAGVEYKFSDKFLASVSFNEFFDKGVDWGTNVYGQERIIENNSWELALGLQYSITDNFAVSIGGMQSTMGISEQYQSDFSYSNSSNTGALGFEWKLNKVLTLDAGVLYTAYKDFTKSFDGYNETYDKENVGIAIGLTYSIF